MSLKSNADSILSSAASRAKDLARKAAETKNEDLITEANDVLDKGKKEAEDYLLEETSKLMSKFSDGEDLAGDHPDYLEGLSDAHERIGEIFMETKEFIDDIKGSTKFPWRGGPTPVITPWQF